MSSTLVSVLVLSALTVAQVSWCAVKRTNGGDGWWCRSRASEATTILYCAAVAVATWLAMGRGDEWVSFVTPAAILTCSLVLLAITPVLPFAGWCLGWGDDVSVGHRAACLSAFVATFGTWSAMAAILARTVFEYVR